MVSNVKDVKKYKTFTKSVISFDKNGKKITKKVTIDDAYLVTLRHDDTILLRAKQLKEYGIVFDELGNLSADKVVEVDNDLEEDETNDENNLPKLPLIKTVEQVVSSSNN